MHTILTRMPHKRHRMTKYEMEDLPDFPVIKEVDGSCHLTRRPGRVTVTPACIRASLYLV